MDNAASPAVEVVASISSAGLVLKICCNSAGNRAKACDESSPLLALLVMFCTIA